MTTQAMARTLSELDSFIDYAQRTGKKIEVISLTEFQTRALRQDIKRANSPQHNNCGRITYPLGMPVYRGYHLRAYERKTFVIPEQVTLQ